MTDRLAREIDLRATARATWRKAMERDDAGPAIARRRRVRARIVEPGAARWFARPVFVLVLGAVLFAATAAAMVTKARRSEPATVDVSKVRRPRPLARSSVDAVVRRPSVAIPSDATPESPAAIPRRASPEHGDDGALLRAAEDSLLRGDRAGAEASLRSLLRVSRDPALRAKAALRIGELLLARGAVEQARAFLVPLTTSSDPAVAADALLLLGARAGAGAVEGR